MRYFPRYMLNMKFCMPHISHEHLKLYLHLEAGAEQPRGEETGAL